VSEPTYDGTVSSERDYLDLELIARLKAWRRFWVFDAETKERIDKVVHVDCRKLPHRVVKLDQDKFGNFVLTPDGDSVAKVCLEGRFEIREKPRVSVADWLAEHGGEET
jgi:hypothetical protein